MVGDEDGRHAIHTRHTAALAMPSATSAQELAFDTNEAPACKAQESGCRCIAKCNALDARRVSDAQIQQCAVERTTFARTFRYPALHADGILCRVPGRVAKQRPISGSDPETTGDARRRPSKRPRQLQTACSLQEAVDRFQQAAGGKAEHVPVRARLERVACEHQGDSQQAKECVCIHWRHVDMRPQTASAIPTGAVRCPGN
jgi:hypothetical protein